MGLGLGWDGWQLETLGWKGVGLDKLESFGGEGGKGSDGGEGLACEVDDDLTGLLDHGLESTSMRREGGIGKVEALDASVDWIARGVIGIDVLEAADKLFVVAKDDDRWVEEDGLWLLELWVDRSKRVTFEESEDIGSREVEETTCFVTDHDLGVGDG